MFCAPLDQPDHAERGVRCAPAIDAFALRYVVEQQARGLEFGVTRIGVNTGNAVVGNFGGGRRFDYTADGDAINIAARLDAATRPWGPASVSRAPPPSRSAASRSCRSAR
jgi:adenylate cyclase